MSERIALSNESMETVSSVRLYTRLWSIASVFHRWIAVAALRASGRSAGRMLDLASGPGLLPISFARRASDWEATGLDISAPMIAEARRRIDAAGLADRVTIVEGSVLAMPFDDASFDLVTMTNGLHMIDDIDTLFGEVERVLVPGGVFYCQAFVRDAPALVRLGAWIQSGMLKLIGSKLEGMYWVLEASYTLDEVRRSVARRPALEGEVRRRNGAFMIVELRKRIDQGP